MTTIIWNSKPAITLKEITQPKDIASISFHIFVTWPFTEAFDNAAMEERPQKLRKLQQLRSEVPYVTKSALEGILTWVQKNGPVPLATAKHMREANRATLAAASAYGPVLLEQKVKMQDGSTMSMPFLNFHSFLHAAYKAGGALFDLLKEVTEPLGLCLYSDEVCPGNPLSGATPRKCWVVYCGLVQTKQHLQNERAWVTLCCLRTSIVSKVEAGMSQILKIILKMIFQSEQADVLDMGILLQGPPGCPDGYERKRLKMCLSFVVQDGQAHKQCWSLKGDSGSRFCGLCKNVFSHNEEEEGISEVSKWTCFKNLDLNSCEEIFSSWDRMAARSGNMSAQDFKTWQQASGITFSNEAILADVSLRNILKPTQQYKHDWMHCLMSNGVLSQGVYHMLEEMDAWKEFHGYIAGWKIPSHWQHAGINVVNLFTEKRIAKHRNSEKFNSTASELLTILPIFCYFLQKVCRAMLQAEAQCIRKLALLVELLQATWFTSIDADAIQRCAEESLVLWNQTNWKMIKKHHWLLHLGEANRKHKIMVACWTMERKHRFVSQIGAAIANTRQLEAGELFAEEEGDSEAKNTKKPKHLSKLPKECTIDVKGIAVVLKTPQHFREDICVQLEASQLDAVCQFILDDLGDCFGKKRTYQQTGKHAKAAKQELAKND